MTTSGGQSSNPKRLRGLALSPLSIFPLIVYHFIFVLRQQAGVRYLGCLGLYSLLSAPFKQMDVPLVAHKRLLKIACLL